MSYLVLARKYRPQLWTDLVGQDHVSTTLQNAIQHDRLAHAYLFTGPRGVGKTSAARILAKALNCEKGPVADPCNRCSNCIEITESRSIDVFEIDGASNRGIDEVRNLRENIRYTPASGKYRIYIIDEVHMLTTEAFNALLKTLEEPPSHVVFIFATTEPHKVPVTIVSRCQRFDFHRISIQEMLARLKGICKEEKITIDDEALLLIANKADGSLRDSQSILDQMISFTGDKITAELVIKGLGLISQDLFFEVTDMLTSGEVPRGLSLVDKIIADGYDVEEFLVGLSEHLRNLLIVRSMESVELIDTTEPLKKKYLESASRFQEEDILRLIRIVTQTVYSLKWSANPRISLELAIVKMIKLDKTVSIDDLLSRLESLRISGNPQSTVVKDAQTNSEKKTNPSVPSEGEPGSNPSSDAEDCPQKTESSQEKKSAMTVDEIQGKWDSVIHEVKKKKITIGSFLQEGVLSGVRDNKIEVSFALSNGFHIDAIMRSKDIVLDVIKKILGPDVDFECIKKDLPGHEKHAQSKNQKWEDLMLLKEKEPVIKKIIDDFDVEIAE
jgi:DNA polymerase-3 subunit gamma/tau